jgi:cytochrome c oxidase assembly protein subunit 15
VLIWAGGLVTSHEAGLAVPDWPTSMGYNMFLFPIDQWVGGIFYEHTHRLLGSLVGLMTIILMVWIFVRDSRRWMRVLGFVALLAVIFQGILGGLRVTLLRDEIGIFHAGLAQLFFVFITFLAVMNSRFWRRYPNVPIGIKEHKRLNRLLVFTTGAIFLQLIIGATMRHEHAGLAVEEYPLILQGQLWPPLDEESISELNRSRMDIFTDEPITATHIVVHMTHRTWAVFVVCLILACFNSLRRAYGRDRVFHKLGTFWVFLVCFQFSLGALTIWTGKSADVATAHVAFGALTLLTSSVLTLLSHRSLHLRKQSVESLSHLDEHETEVTPILNLSSIS